MIDGIVETMIIIRLGIFKRSIHGKKPRPNIKFLGCSQCYLSLLFALFLRVCEMASAISCPSRSENQNLSDLSSIAAAFSEGKSRRDLAREQTDLLKIYSLIKPTKLVMHGTVLELTGPHILCVLMKI